jgi:hypothetical protein
MASISRPAASPAIARPYRDERDGSRIRSLLAETHALVPPRPRRPDDAFESLRVTEFWRDFPTVLSKARQGGVLITWYSDAAAVLAPLPEGWHRGEAA